MPSASQVITAPRAGATILLALGTVLANEEVVDGKSEVGGFEVIRKPMRQWVLKITEYADRLLDYYKRRPEAVRPETRLNEVVSFIEGGLRDLSISRTSFTWGIPVPGDPKHVMYVWFDALLNARPPPLRPGVRYCLMGGGPGDIDVHGRRRTDARDAQVPQRRPPQPWELWLRDAWPEQHRHVAPRGDGAELLVVEVAPVRRDTRHPGVRDHHGLRAVVHLEGVEEPLAVDVREVDEDLPRVEGAHVVSAAGGESAVAARERRER